MDPNIASLPPGDPKLISTIVDHLKSQGLFDQFRKHCLSDIDTKPGYQNLRQRVEGYVANFLQQQQWRADLNKNQLRDSLRRNINESGMLAIGVDRIVEQVVNPKVYQVFYSEIASCMFKLLGKDVPASGSFMQKCLDSTMESANPEVPGEEKSKLKLDSDRESLQKIIGFAEDAPSADNNTTTAVDIQANLSVKQSNVEPEEAKTLPDPSQKEPEARSTSPIPTKVSIETQTDIPMESSKSEDDVKSSSSKKKSEEGKEHKKKSSSDSEKKKKHDGKKVEKTDKQIEKKNDKPTDKKSEKQKSEKNKHEKGKQKPHGDSGKESKDAKDSKIKKEGKNDKNDKSKSKSGSSSKSKSDKVEKSKEEKTPKNSEKSKESLTTTSSSSKSSKLSKSEKHTSSESENSSKGDKKKEHKRLEKCDKSKTGETGKKKENFNKEKTKSDEKSDKKIEISDIKSESKTDKPEKKADSKTEKSGNKLEKSEEKSKTKDIVKTKDKSHSKEKEKTNGKHQEKKNISDKPKVEDKQKSEEKPKIKHADKEKSKIKVEEKDKEEGKAKSIEEKVKETEIKKDPDEDIKFEQTDVEPSTELNNEPECNKRIKTEPKKIKQQEVRMKKVKSEDKSDLKSPKRKNENFKESKSKRSKRNEQGETAKDDDETAWSDVTVSSVHTSDLSDYDDHISLTDSEIDGSKKSSAASSKANSPIKRPRGRPRKDQGLKHGDLIKKKLSLYQSQIPVPAKFLEPKVETEDAEPRRGLRRQRKVNPRYSSDDFASIFSKGKDKLQFQQDEENDQLFMDDEVKDPVKPTARGRKSTSDQTESDLPYSPRSDVSEFDTPSRRQSKETDRSETVGRPSSPKSDLSGDLQSPRTPESTCSTESRRRQHYDSSDLYKPRLTVRGGRRGRPSERYNDSDLYKPRPIITSTRRGRGSSPNRSTEISPVPGRLDKSSPAVSPEARSTATTPSSDKHLDDIKETLGDESDGNVSSSDEDATFEPDAKIPKKVEAPTPPVKRGRGRPRKYTYV